MDQAFWTLVGAAVAAVSGVLNLWWRHTDRQDRIYVGLGNLMSRVSPSTDLYAVNLSSHSVEITDFGFVLMNGKLNSLPIYWELDPPEAENGWSTGKQRLAPRESFQAGAEIRGHVAGVYAITSTQRRPTMRMSPDLGLLQGRRLWLRAWWLQEYA